MTGPRTRRWAAAWLLTLAAGAGWSLRAVSQEPAGTAAIEARERAYRANNIGVARLEQFDTEGAAAAFREALAIDSRLALARLNLGIALFYAGQTAEAETAIREAQADLPGRPHADYVLGLIARAAGRTADALAAFDRVRQIDPGDVGTAINLGQLHWQERRDAEAIAAFRQALAAEPYNGTALYGLATALLRTGVIAEGEDLMSRFERLTDAGAAVTYAQAYMQQGRYAAAFASTGLEPELISATVPDVAFTDGRALLPPGDSQGAGTTGVTLVDLDGDDDLDAIAAGATGLRLLRNDNARFVEATEVLGAAGAVAASGVLAGDFDNDDHTDLVVLRPAGIGLLRQGADGAFADVTATAGLSAAAGTRTAAWLDADHDGDLDLLAADNGDGALHLWRNNGNATFTDTTAAAGLVEAAGVAAIVPTDFDNRRDIDVLAVSRETVPRLFRNLRDGSFRDVGNEAALPAAGGAAMAAAGDVNKDDFTDLLFVKPAGVAMLATSDGRGAFELAPLPAIANATAAQFVDYDSDGALDIVALSAGGPRVLRRAGDAWIDTTARAIPASMTAALAGSRVLATGDVDGDGRVDLLAPDTAGNLTLWRATGNGSPSTLQVRLDARVSNRTAAGARVEMRAGSLRQQHEVYAAFPAPAPAHVLFGLGDRTGADVVRVLWPSGILQAETGTNGAATLPSGAVAIEELDRKPSSCPYLYTWDGEQFVFVSDFLGGGEMGYWQGPGVRNTPDPDEYVRISGDQLRPRNGRYELRITNELEEALFVDRAQLVVVAHPRGVDVHPNEGLARDPSPFTIYTTRAARPPLAARTDDGIDVLDAVSRIDRRYADGFDVAPIRGYAADHALTLTLPPAGADGSRLLLMTGWTDYAFSSDNVAAHQAGLTLSPPSLEVRQDDGTWRTAIASIGIPVGRPQTVVVDLRDRVPPGATDVRIRTSMRIYWDRVLVDTATGAAPYTLERIEAASALLRWRGFSDGQARVTGAPETFDYQRVSARSPWKLMPGRYTREGDVRELLTATDDMFVVSRSGDEIALSFDARAVAPLPDGWTHTFLLYADGFSKEMNLHSSSPDQLLPLPFHGMTAYPYEAPEAYPSSPAHRAYRERYNTRVVPRTLPPIELAIAD